MTENDCAIPVNMVENLLIKRNDLKMKDQMKHVLMIAYVKSLLKSNDKLFLRQEWLTEVFAKFISFVDKELRSMMKETVSCLVH